MTTYRVVAKTSGYLGTMEDDYKNLEDALERKASVEKDHYKPDVKIYQVELVEKLKLVKVK